MLDRIPEFILGIVIMFLIWAVFVLIEHMKIKSQINRINWGRKNLKYDYLNSLGFEFAEAKYCFSYEQDKLYVLEILSNFNKFMQNSFFEKTLTLDKKLCKLSDQEYIMFYLNSYLEGQKLTKKIAGEEPLKISNEGNSNIYYLSESGFAFYRLLYITESYCEQNHNINKTNLFHSNIYTIKNILDSGHM